MTEQLKAEIEQGLGGILNSILDIQTQEAQAHNFYKFLVEKPELFSSPEEFKFKVLYGLNNSIKEAIKTVKSGNSEYAEIFLNYQFYENHIERLCTQFEGSFASADKSSAIVSKYLKYLITGDKGQWEAGQEVYIERLGKNIGCYWLPVFGTQEQWYALLHGLYLFKNGYPQKYLEAYKALIEATQGAIT